MFYWFLTIRAPQCYILFSTINNSYRFYRQYYDTFYQNKIKSLNLFAKKLKYNCLHQTPLLNKMHCILENNTVPPLRQIIKLPLIIIFLISYTNTISVIFYWSFINLSRLWHWKVSQVIAWYILFVTLLYFTW